MLIIRNMQAIVYMVCIVPFCPQLMVMAGAHGYSIFNLAGTVGNSAVTLFVVMIMLNGHFKYSPTEDIPENNENTKHRD